jgi:hypothetical protein
MYAKIMKSFKTQTMSCHESGTQQIQGIINKMKNITLEKKILIKC